MNSNKPTRKVGASGLAGALSIVLVWGMNLLGLSVPGEVGSAITMIISFATGYLVADSET